MSISKEDILKLYKPSPIDEKLINKPALDIFDLLLVKESQPPNKEKKEITNSMYFNNVEENWHKSNSNNIEFNRGGNFKPKEENVDIKIENIYLFNKKLNIPEDIKSFYVKNSNYNNFMGPFSSKEIEEQYKNKKINSLFEFRPIDIFMFKNKQLFTFENLKLLNDENWINNIEENSLLKYSKNFNTNQKENNQEKENESNEKLGKNISEKNIENKQNEEKETKTEEKKLNNEKKEEETKNKINEETKNEKEEDKKEEKKEEKKQKKEEKKEDKKENKNLYIKEEEGEWEDPYKKKNKRKQKEKEKEKELTNKTPVGIATKKDIKISQANTLIKDTKENYNVEDLLNELKPKNKNEKEKIPVESFYNEDDYKQKKNKGKKKKKIYEANIETGFKY